MRVGRLDRLIPDVQGGAAKSRPALAAGFVNFYKAIAFRIESFAVLDGALLSPRRASESQSSRPA